jgi:hypothetical protein
MDSQKKARSFGRGLNAARVITLPFGKMEDEIIEDQQEWT